MPDVTERLITDLAARVKEASQNDDGYILLLGAGASMSSNVPPTHQIIKNLLDDKGSSIEGDSELDRFDSLWNTLDDDTRLRWLEPYLNNASTEPSSGYRKLADLIGQGYFRLVISFNFDVLLQRALGNTDYEPPLEIVAGYDPVDKIEKQLDSRPSQPKIYQLHGSFSRPATLKFSADDVFSYEPQVEAILKRLTAKNLIVCGYKFDDFNVIRSFADFGKSLWWVNLEPPPRPFKAIQRKRNSEKCLIVGSLGHFDEFFGRLHAEVTRSADPRRAQERAEYHNPFKFLASHRESDQQFLFYRRRSVRKLYSAIKEHRPRTLHFAGKRMAGKTSLLRAGLLPMLRGTEFAPVYIRRCGAQIAERLPEKIRRATGLPLKSTTIADALQELCEMLSNKHVVLILDQFERTITALGEMNNDSSKAILDTLFKKKIDNLTVVPVFVDDVHFGDSLYISYANDSDIEYIRDNMYQQLQPLDKHQVRRIVRFQARRAQAGLPDELLDRLIAQYDPRKFTLAHIETICHLLTARINLDRRLHMQDLEAGSKLVTALNSALLDHDILSYLEDLPMPEEQNLLRNVLLAASNSSRQNIAEYLKDNFSNMHQDQIWTPDQNIQPEK